MDGMMALLLLPLCAIKAAEPACTNTLFVDDRSFSGEDAATCMRVRHLWKHWSTLLGLVENDSKDQFFHRTQEGRDCLIAEGATPSSTTDTPKLLGVTFAGNTGRVYTDGEKHKLATSLAIVNRCALLPLRPRMRITCALSAGIAKASWGWLAKTVTGQTAKTFDTAMALLANEPISARSPHLASIFRGHAASLSYMAGQQAVVAAWTNAKRNGVPPGSWRGTPLANTIRSFFRRWNWDLVAPWKFTNCNISDEATTVSLDPAGHRRSSFSIIINQLHNATAR